MRGGAHQAAAAPRLSPAGCTCMRTKTRPEFAPIALDRLLFQMHYHPLVT